MRTIFVAGFGGGRYIIGYKSGPAFAVIGSQGIHHYGPMESYGTHTIEFMLTDEWACSNLDRDSISKWYNKHYNNLIVERK